MQRPYVSSNAAPAIEMGKPALVTLLFLIGLLTAAGCVQGPREEARFSVSDSGALSLSCGECTVSEDEATQVSNISVSRVILHTGSGDVYGLLTAPDDPVAGFVLAPGAGVRKEMHYNRSITYARAGYAFLVLDLRGNGGETTGYPFSIDRDFQRFREGDWPQYYLSICDLIHAGEYVKERYGIPVYAAGSSNGGRYAAIATALDPVFSGYIGVSTSGFGLAGNQYSGDARLFLLSIDPDLYMERISPKSSWIFHSRSDEIIPFEEGRALYNLSGEPRIFHEFPGSHGLCGEVDEKIIDECAQIYGVRS